MITRRAVLGAPLLLALPRGQRPDPLAALLAEEHAAIHLYGVVGPRLPEALREAARAAYDDHRRHRDALVAAIRRAGGTPEPPRLTYALPSPVTDATSARGVALAIEDALALRWHEAVRVVAPGERRAAAEALGDEAAHLAVLRWHVTHSLTQSASPFPGR